MNLGEIRDIIVQFSDAGKQPEDFNSLLHWASSELFAMKFAQGDKVALAPFQANRGDGTVPLFVVNGIATLPDDYHGWPEMSVVYDGTYHRVKIVDNKFWNIHKASSIEYPDKKYPIARIEENQVRVLPKTTQYIILDYLKKPRVPVFGWTNTNGFVEYDPTTSTELEWEDAQQVEIIVMILSSLGVAVTKEQINDRK